MAMQGIFIRLIKFKEKERMTDKYCDYYRYDYINNKTIVYNLYFADKLIDVIKEYPEIDTKTYNCFVFDGIISKDILDSIKI